MTKRKADMLMGNEDEHLYTFKIKRLMNPEDANVFGSVHGGTILRLIEEAGAVMATRYCNMSVNGQDVRKNTAVAALARVERTDFLQPMHIGEVAELEATLLYTSSRSVQVGVTVHAENVMKGGKRLTNRARLWYVPISSKDSTSVLPVPPMTYVDDIAEERGRLDYERQKAERASQRTQTKRQRKISMADVSDGSPVNGVAASKTQLIHFVGANDVTVAGNCKGGVILKLMDECAGIVAVKHCHTVVVTASFDAINLHKRVIKGGLITVTGHATYTSSRTIEVQVVVDVELPWQPEDTKQRVVDGFITFVSLDKATSKPLPISQLKVFDEEERGRFEAGRLRYERQKRLRAEQLRQAAAGNKK